MSFSVTVVICTIGRKNELKKALIGISQQSRLPEEVVVVIGPDGEDYSFIDQLPIMGFKLSKHFINKKNLSWARNLGILKSSSEYLLFLDDDAIPEPGLLENYSKSIASGNKNILGGFCRIGGFLNWQHQKQILNTNFEIRQPREFERPSTGEFFSPMGANFLVKRSTALEIDGFDNFLAWWGDDADFALRLKKLGYEVEFVPEAVVHHFQAKSDIRDEDLVPKSQYIPWRSHAYLASKHSLHFGQTSKFISWRRAECKLGLMSLRISNRLNQVEYESQVSELDAGIREGVTQGIANRYSPISGTKDVRLVEFDDVKNHEISYKERVGFSSTVFIYREGKSDYSGGIANWIYDSAKSISHLGHAVTVISDGTHQWESQVSFHSGFWDIKVGREELYFLSVGLTALPNDLQTFGVAAKNLVNRLDSGFKFTSIVVPIFEGIGNFFLQDSRLVTSLHTSTKESLENHPLLPFNEQFNNRFSQIIEAENNVLRKSPRILANSKAILKKYEIENDPRIELIPHGVGTATFDGQTFDHVRFVKSNPVCTFLGRWEPRKGSAFLPDILDSLLSLGINVIVAGADPFNLRKAALDKLEIRYPDNLKILGVVSEKEKALLISKSDVVMVPSIFESFGLIAIEALLGGAGVCAYKGSGVEECLSKSPHSRFLPIGSTSRFAQECAELAMKMYCKSEFRLENIDFANSNYGDEIISVSLTKYFA